MSTFDNNMSTCAACGKGGDGLKTCNGCKMVKYCNATCQEVHRPKHKKECKKRAAELHDEALFKQPPPNEECPICCLTLPVLASGATYQECCGKIVCRGCTYGVIDAAEGERDEIKCAFCRSPAATPGGELTKELIEKVKKRVEADDPHATFHLGLLYKLGERGLPQDYTKANELWLRAGKLGSYMGYDNIAESYENGRGVERDVKKAKHYYELAAMGGSAVARHNLGTIEGNSGNTNRAVKHLMISAGAGYDGSLTTIRKCFSMGWATKEDFEKALRAHKAANDEMKSAQREAAAASARGRN